MMTRIITGAGLLLMLLTVLYFGGWAFAVVWIAAVMIAVAEEFSVLTKAEHRPVAWPSALGASGLLARARSGRAGRID